MTYFITFSCYGTHLHGDESGSVDRYHNQVGARMLPEDPGRQLAEQRVMNAERYYLSGDRRAAVLEALRDVCLHRGWNLLAAHIRTTHLHVIVESNTCPEKVMNAFKSYASRRLNLLEQERPDRKRWTRHGSTRWLWKDLDMREAVRYVVEEQGRPMAVFVSDEL